MRYKIKFYYQINKKGCVETLAHVLIEKFVKEDVENNIKGTKTLTLLIGVAKQNAMDVHKIGTGQLVALERAIHDLTDEEQKQIVNSYGQKFPKENNVKIDIKTIIKANQELLGLMLYLSTNVLPVGPIEIFKIFDGVEGVAIACDGTSTELHIYSTGRMFIHMPDSRVYKPNHRSNIDKLIETILLLGGKGGKTKRNSRNSNKK